MLIRGDKLNFSQRQMVLRAFVHRWTHENAKQTYGGGCPGCIQSTRDGVIVTGRKKPGACEAPLRVWTREEWHAYHVPLTTDAEWLKAHAFHFISDGARLKENKDAEPACLADGS